ncbi:sigma factor-like helix-turn-helix DNA-binding protein [Rhodococcus sp. (in: high G+C Gram-positive bacteria)]|uniref:sigma factor-like helix-turn-helix DNA-binding protein n=1 Tax=Rhodococcus sp. TaxID=1831 RepID=UPI003B8A9984
MSSSSIPPVRAVHLDAVAAAASHDTQHAWSLIDVLTARERTILRLRIVEQQSAAETARVLNTTPGAVRVAQHRALNRLRAQLAS